MTFGTSSQITVGDLIFDIRSIGPEDGEPLIALHGFPETSLSWTSVAPRLADEGFRVHAPDQRGYSPGARPEGVEAYSTSLLANDVIGIADGLGLDTFHLVGHDWGSAVAWVVAGSQPGRIRTLTAVSMPHLGAYSGAIRSDPDQQERAGYIKVFRAPGKAEDLLLEDGARRLRAMYGGDVPSALADQYVEDLAEPGALTAALNWYRAMGADLASTARTQVPTTFVWGETDMAIGRAAAEACGDFIDADYRFIELAGIGHWIPEQAPDSLAEAIIVRALGR